MLSSPPVARLVWRCAPVRRQESRLPLCGIPGMQNITRCGIRVKDFLPQSGNLFFFITLVRRFS